jgi:hypothetical protein
MNPMDILNPNYLGKEYENRGTDSLMNKGWGVAEVQPKEDEEENGMVRNVRRGAARQFGQKIGDVFNDENTKRPIDNNGTGILHRYQGGFSRESYGG